MSALTPVLVETIKELQSLPSLKTFVLAGGTNLAYRFNHRESQDIDLFCSEIIGVKHFETIENEVVEFYGSNNITGIIYPPGKEDEQYVFLRLYIQKLCGTIIKVEIIQNMKMIDAIEVIDDIRLATTQDIGLYKLISGSNRAAKKDIYDLDFVTDQITLPELFQLLQKKEQRFNNSEDRNIFDLDDEESPLANPSLLLKFDGVQPENNIKPIHSNDNIVITEGSKSWQLARLNWRAKVRELFTLIGYQHNFH
jgi:hypothetical protein